MKISYVIPIYNEEDALPHLTSALTDFLEKGEFTEEVEVVLVDDGSVDQSWPMIADLATRDPRFVAARLSRNFGHQFALTAGYALAQGDAIICMDADMQDPLEVTAEFIRKWRAGYDIVYGVRKKRDGETLFKRASASFFYKLLVVLGDSRAPQNSGDFRLLSRRALDALNRLPERHRYIRGLVGWIGLKSTVVEFDRGPRVAGSTKYPFRKMARFATDAIVSMSTTPLRFSYYLAIATSAVFLGYLMITVIKSLFFGVQMVPGWSSLIASIVAFGALNLFCLGLIGEYVGRIYEEVKRRPLYLMDEVIRDGKSDGGK